jgi:bacillithiol system protein YtxJ
VLNKENIMSGNLREVDDENVLNELRAAETAILYKHSTRCPTSWNAKREVDRFLERRPDAPVYLIDVVSNRALSQRVAEMFGVKHESPQAILLRSGEVVDHVSHRHITAQLLESWLIAAR